MALRRKSRDTSLDTTARGIGRSLGHLAGRVDQLNRQRAAVATEIKAVLAEAQAMLADLGDDVEILRHRGRKAARRAKRNVSAAARARMSAAQKKRWAKYRRNKKAA